MGSFKPDAAMDLYIWFSLMTFDLQGHFWGQIIFNNIFNSSNTL